MFTTQSRKGSSAMTLGVLAIGFVVAGVIIAVGTQINAEMTPAGFSAVDNTTREIVGNSTEGLKKFAKFMPLLATVFVGAVIIGALSLFGGTESGGL